MRIIGIDIGNTSVKAVEVDSAFGRYEVHEYHERPVAEGMQPFEAVRELISSLPKTPDRIVTALRTGQVTFRNLQLPTRDKKSIQSSVGFELEDELPFPMEQALYDYSVLSQSGQSSQLHVVATLKRYVETTLADYNSAGVDPDLLTTEAWAYRTLFNRVLTPTQQENPVLLIQMGSQRTILYVHWRGYPLLSRELNWGGRDLTTAISQKYGLPYDQAEAAKLDHGFILTDTQKEAATPDQIEFSKTMEDAFQDLFQSVRQIELAAKGFSRLPISQVYLAGGTALLPGITKFVEDVTNTPVQPLRAMSATASTELAYSEPTDAKFSLAAGLALCLVGADKNTAINLRSGAFAKMGRSREFNLSSLKGPMMGLGAVTASLVLSLVIQGSFYRAQIEDANSKLERGIRSFFGTVSSSAVRTYMSNTSTLRAQVTKELGKEREMAKLFGANPHSPIDFLKSLSAGVSKDIVTDMVQFQVGSAPTQKFSSNPDTTVSLTFLVANTQVAERLATALSGKMTGMTKSPLTEATSDDGTKRFKITFTGKPTNEAYGE